MKTINLTSLHDYLDLLFEDKTPSKQEVISAKKVYWRAYNTDLKRRRRLVSPVFQVSFSKQECTLLQSKLEKGQPVSKFIYKIVMKHLQDNKEIGSKVNTALIEQQLFFITQYLSELIEFETIDTKKLTELEKRIHSLEQIIETIL